MTTTPTNDFTENVKRRLRNLVPLLQAAAKVAEDDDRDADAAIFATAANFMDGLRSSLNLMVITVSAEPAEPAEAPAPAEAPKHRHSYDEAGKCKSCGALSRAAKKQTSIPGTEGAGS